MAVEFLDPSALTPFFSLFIEDVNLETLGFEFFITLETFLAETVPLLGYKNRKGIRSWNFFHNFERKLHRWCLH
jgi:hypothetical protein